MKDKEMIEEMVIDCCSVCAELYGDCNCKKDKCPSVKIESKRLIENGWVKLPKDSVVLSKEEYVRLQLCELKSLEPPVYIDRDKIEQEIIEKYNQKLKEHSAKRYAKARKETAEKFAKKIQDYLNDKVCEEFWDYACDVTYFTIDVDKVISDVFDLAKQFGVEIKEYRC